MSDSLYVKCKLVYMNNGYILRTSIEKTCLNKPRMVFQLVQAMFIWPAGLPVKTDQLNPLDHAGRAPHPFFLLQGFVTVEFAYVLVTVLQAVCFAQPLL